MSPSAPAPPVDFAFALDVDGVLFRGGASNPIPGSPEVLAALQHHRIPHVLITNGTGILEAEKAREIQDMVRSYVADEAHTEAASPAAAAYTLPEDAVVIASTPMRSLVTHHGWAKKRVLAVAWTSEFALRSARAYGFENVVTVDEYLAKHPVLVAGNFVDAPVHTEPGHWDDVEPIEGVLLFHLTLGAFRESLATLFQLAVGRKLETIQFGKPFPEMYAYTERALALQFYRSTHGTDPADIQQDLPLPGTIYAVGDNPLSDIKGANGRGAPWTSVLVRTGNFNTDAPNDPDNPAAMVCDDLLQAFRQIAAAHGLPLGEDLC
ncbi:hypothetical protein H696_01439 [Fonticula alba]|uniref:Rhodanese domain-containing protein n=1 Tax=Fonticula alba TaxID=691883 RepID=A0A058ZDM9_FONAL|nr:hypothetical protein H696_01439 [Fonticula alba]KCV72033.1 hypothetical protein H696_01439 [Fonticula alba]|eukprot:XP_009493611.1 hypothetical protein H696_01439 [Fonticula alba]